MRGVDALVAVELGSIRFRLLEVHDFSWLEEYGRVFRVFDEQDSGNIGFGVAKDDTKLFIKYAGARTIGYDGTPEDAVHRLARAVSAFRALRHPHLVDLVEAKVIGDGYAVVFEWFEGENLRTPIRPNPQLFALSVEERMRMFGKILEFHRHVEEMEYVAIDFYDGSLIYSYQSGETRICDIDFYSKKPYANSMGRLWGSGRFMSPEEFTLGAAIDQRTNVFNMGATAFFLFGGTLDRSRDKWVAGDELYRIALKAVSRAREDRHGNVARFHEVWSYASC